MTFEEEFPNLCIKEDVNAQVKDLRYTRLTMEKLLEDIQAQCIDKQRVKEAIEKVLRTIHEDEWGDYRHYFSELEEELGL